MGEVLLKRLNRIILFIAGLIVLAVFVYLLPPVRSRLEWRIENWIAEVRYFSFNPPQEAVFIPEGGDATLQANIDLQVTETLRALIPSATASPAPTGTAPPTIVGPTPTPTFTASPTLPPTPIPDAVTLSGFRHEYETWNNCGPATLAMQLSFWGWTGNQVTTASFLKPNPRDKNVSPHELVAYVESETDLRALVRVGGTLDLLKTLVAAGFPVIVEKTLDLQGVDGWIGHYSLISAYDDALGQFSTQDSYIQPDYPEPYVKLTEAWRSFNYKFIVIYPPAREDELFDTLGEYADPMRHVQIALDRAEREIAEFEGLPEFFAWFNKGTSLTELGDLEGAGVAFDTAFALYADLPQELRPWRVAWYQHEVYEVYFALDRFQDVVDLADWTIANGGEPALEESFYWRALAKEQLGNLDEALFDIRQAVQWNPNYQAASEALARLENNR